MLPTLTPEPLYQVKYKPGIPRNRTKGNALRAYTIPENPCSYCYINPETVTGAECTLASQLVPVFEPLEVVMDLVFQNEQAPAALYWPDNWLYLVGAVYGLCSADPM